MSLERCIDRSKANSQMKGIYTLDSNLANSWEEYVPIPKTICITIPNSLSSRQIRQYFYRKKHCDCVNYRIRIVRSVGYICTMEFVSPEGLRLDGRRDKELRKIEARLNVLQSADGSATFEMGNTKVRSNECVAPCMTTMIPCLIHCTRLAVNLLIQRIYIVYDIRYIVSSCYRR